MKRLMSRRWLSERKSDPYHRRAKKEGFRSRAAYKLKHLNRRFGFLKDARYVLDLGAAPGGWLQVVGEEVKDGLIVGVDLGEIKPLENKNVRTLIGDVMDHETLAILNEVFPVPVDVVLSDLSPNISGIWDVDHLRQLHLARRAMRIAGALLKPEGWLVVKAFQGSGFEAFLTEVRQIFSDVKTVKPRSSRRGSAEIYIVAKGVRSNRKVGRSDRERID